jgi:hypothetical protein
VRRRVREQRNDLEHLDDASRPTMRQNQWYRRRPCADLMDEVDAMVVDLSDELWKRIQVRFVRPPIILIEPVVDEALHVGHRRAVTPWLG